VKAFILVSLVTEWVVASVFTAVTVAPGGTRRADGEKVELLMVMKKPGPCGAGAGDELLLPEDPPHASATAAAAASEDFVIPRMSPSVRSG
jgi:hypothetical protein